MKRLTLIVLALASACSSFAQEFPEPSKRLVNDYANVLSDEQENALEQKLIAYDDSTSTQIAIVIMKSVGTYEVSDFAVRLAEKWGIGGKEKNNGVLILAAIEDRKVTIQSGYGMEGVLPDAITKRIIENEIKPSFKQQDYYTGFDQATSAIIAAAKGEYKGDGKRKKGKKDLPFALIAIIVIGIVMLISRKGGGGGTRINGMGGAGLPLWMLMSSGSGRGSYGDFSSGGGSFGGFGGGSFGGGGSSGSW